MYYFVEILCVIVEIAVCHIFFRSFFGKSVRNRLVTTACYSIFGIVLAALSFVSDASMLRIIYCLVGLTAISLYLFRAKFFFAVFAGITFLTIYALTDVVVIVMLSVLNVDTQFLFSYGNIRSLFIVISHLILLAIILFISLFNKSKQGVVTVQTVAFLFPSWLSCIVLCCDLVMQANKLHTDFHPIYLVVILGLLYTNILMIYFVNRIREQDRQKHDADLTEHHYSMEKEYYEQFFAQKEQIRALWHDISKYMKAMQALVSDSNSSEAEKNIAEAQALVDEIPDVVDVGNRVVSIILNEYMNLARNEGIDLRLDVSVPPELFIPTADLYVMLGNTLDNAIEACSELEDDRRYINLRLRMHNNILHYMVENPYAKEHLLKQRIGVHGYGLKNVERCVEKYGGFVQKTSENESFTVNITISKAK